MKLLITGAALALAAASLAQDAPKKSYTLRGDYFESCECHVYCPCVFRKDATADQCRALVVWHVKEGRYDKTDLKGVDFVVAVTKTGKNVETALGKWEGVLYVSDKASEEQRQAVSNLMSEKMGGAFAKLDTKVVPMTVRFDGETSELDMGSIAKVKITALKGANGKIPSIENPPSPIIPTDKIYCAQADVHTYDDGASKWDFKGNNGFYGPFEYKQ